MWRIEVAVAGALRRAGTGRGPALWLVHGFGESGFSFVPLLSTSLPSAFELLAPDWPGAGVTPVAQETDSLEALADWLGRMINDQTPTRPIGLVGHSLGAAVATRAIPKIATKVVGLFSIEGNLTEGDAYFSGEATRFEAPEAFRDHLLRRVRSMAEKAAPRQSEALWRYHASLTFAAAEALWKIGRSAKAESTRDALGEGYRALQIPSLYYWSPDNTPLATQNYLRKHGIPSVAFSGGHWPMVERPQHTAEQIASFFEPLFAELG